MQQLIAQVYRLRLLINQSLANQKRIGLLVCASIIFVSGFTKAQEALQDYQIKAAMLYKFIGYSSWPDSRFASPDSAYRIYILGAEDIKNELEIVVAERRVNNRSIEVYSASTVNQLEDAHMVFVSRQMEKVLPRLSTLAKKNSLLIVTEHDEGIVPGSTINLRRLDDRIGFDISLASTQDYGISLSSRLLSVAASVQEGPK